MSMPHPPAAVPEHAEHTPAPVDEPEAGADVILTSGPRVFGIDMGVTIPGFKPMRPDFGQAMVDVDVEAARATAVRLEQELAETERLLQEKTAELESARRGQSRWAEAVSS